MKKIGMAILGAIMAFTSFATMGCTKKVPDTPETLEIFIQDLGYGTAWLDEMIELFKEQDWVKEKYPNLIIPVPRANSSSSFAETQMNAGPSTNTYDLLFATRLSQYTGPDGDAEELTQSVYYSQVPGEDILWIEKSLSSYNQSNRYIDVTDINKERYYMTSWAGGMDTILYNETQLQSLGLSVPRTTDELIEACRVAKENENNTQGKYKWGFSFIQSREATNYFDNLFPAWWAQYEGIDRFFDFWNGIDDNRYSVDIFRQEGRLHALQVMADILDYSKGYLDLDTFSYMFMQQQTSFLQGKGLFMANGDWFENEMRDIRNEIIATEGRIDNFKTMRLPIVSALGTKLGITDAELAAIVDYVDGTVTTEPSFTPTGNYTKAQIIAAVREARSINHSIGPGHMALIPKYANGKQVAIDFLRFMATDIAIEQYVKTTGAVLPFNYNVKEKLPEVYASFNDLQKTRLDYLCTDAFEVYTLPTSSSFPLVAYGGLGAFATNSDYFSTFSASGNKITPQYLYDYTISVWTQSKWNEALSKAGISA